MNLLIIWIVFISIAAILISIFMEFLRIIRRLKFTIIIRFHNLSWLINKNF